MVNYPCVLVKRDFPTQHADVLGRCLCMLAYLSGVFNMLEALATGTNLAFEAVLTTSHSHHMNEWSLGLTDMSMPFDPVLSLSHCTDRGSRHSVHQVQVVQE